MSLVDDLTGELARTLGLKPQEDWKSSIEEAIHVCETRTASSDTAPLRTRILEEVATRITVPETHFFRNHAQLAFCADHLSRTAARERRVARMWCAGSATGEEAYTIAMLVDHLSADDLKTRLRITASDINGNAVRKAREAVYTSWSFRGAPSWCFAYFLPHSTGLVTLKPSPLREVVSFEVESCQAGAEARADASVDVITFRNVAIYLEARATQELYRSFARILRPGGILAIGPSDPRPKGGLFDFSEYYDDAPIFVKVQEAKTQETKAQQTKAQETKSKSDSPSVSKSRLSKPPLTPQVTPTVKRPISSAFTYRELRSVETTTANNAFSVVSTLAEGDPNDPVALRLLGQAHLSRGDAVNAERVLRQSVFLASDDVLTRYFYALALREGGDTRQALRQLRNVALSLEEREKGERLSDLKTEAGDLLMAAKFLEEQWS